MPAIATPAPAVNAPADESGAAALVHRCDQRKATISFKNETIDEEGSNEVRIRQHGANSTKFVGNTSSVLWPVAVHCGHYLCEKYSEVQEDVKVGKQRAQSTSIRNLTAVELGAGTGLVGVIAAHLRKVFAKVVITDQTMELIDANIEMQPAAVRRGLAGRVLSWGNEQHIAGISEEFGLADVVLASDVIYPGAMQQDAEGMEGLVGMRRREIGQI